MTTKTSTKQQHQQQIRERCVMKVYSAGDFVDGVAAFNAFLRALRAKELTRLGEVA